MQEENKYRKLRHELNTEEHEYTATSLAKKLGLSKRVVSQAENDGDVSLTTLKAYHDFFNVPIEYLLGDEGSTRKYESINIGKVTGLTDEAIKMLGQCKEVGFSNTASDFIGHQLFLQLIQFVKGLKDTRNDRPTLVEETSVKVDVMLAKHSHGQKDPLIKHFASFDELIAARKLMCQEKFNAILEDITNEQ